jgi:hypothetical protein
MADREGLVFKFFKNWKQNRLNKFAKKMLKDNPGLEASLKKWDAVSAETLKQLKKID